MARSTASSSATGARRTSAACWSSSLELFKHTVAYEILSGHARGRRRIVSDGELLRCFRAFLFLARRFCVDRGDEGPDVAELEVNPFAFRHQRLVPLDGRGLQGPAARARPARPAEKIERLLEPRAIAVLGVSSETVNLGRIILRNVIACGFPLERTFVVKPDEEAIDGVRCVASIVALPQEVDLLVIAASARQLSALVRETIESAKVSLGAGPGSDRPAVLGLAHASRAKAHRRSTGFPRQKDVRGALEAAPQRNRLRAGLERMNSICDRRASRRSRAGTSSRE